VTERRCRRLVRGPVDAERWCRPFVRIAHAPCAGAEAPCIEAQAVRAGPNAPRQDPAATRSRMPRHVTSAGGSVLPRLTMNARSGTRGVPPLPPFLLRHQRRYPDTFASNTR
jgi:hypothetical protein